jgi:hypothetical protein
MSATSIKDKTISRWFAASELAQILAAAAIALTFVMKQSGDLWVLALLLFSIALVTRMRGRVLTKRSEDALMSGYHVVNDKRLRTLETLQVDVDIRDVLAELKGSEPMRANDLIKHLEHSLGEARAKEKLDVILRYTATTKPEPALVVDGAIIGAA